MILILEDNKWLMAIDNWAAGVDPEDENKVQISYVWDEEGKPTGYTVTLPIAVKELLDFIRAHASEVVLDLRPLQKTGTR